jgi:hypothetical protein
MPGICHDRQSPWQRDRSRPVRSIRVRPSESCWHPSTWSFHNELIRFSVNHRVNSAMRARDGISCLLAEGRRLEGLESLGRWRFRRLGIQPYRYRQFRHSAQPDRIKESLEQWRHRRSAQLSGEAVPGRISLQPPGQVILRVDSAIGGNVTPCPNPVEDVLTAQPRSRIPDRYVASGSK